MAASGVSVVNEASKVTASEVSKFMRYKATKIRSF